MPLSNEDFSEYNLLQITCIIKVNDLINVISYHIVSSQILAHVDVLTLSS